MSDWPGPRRASSLTRGGKDGKDGKDGALVVAAVGPGTGHLNLSWKPMQPPFFNLGCAALARKEERCEWGSESWAGPWVVLVLLVWPHKSGTRCLSLCALMHTSESDL